MSYYDGDRNRYQPASDGYASHPAGHPSYYNGPMDMVPGGGRGSRDSLHHPSNTNSDYYGHSGHHGYGYGPPAHHGQYGTYQPRHHRVTSLQEGGSRRPRSYHGDYDDGYDDGHYSYEKPRHHRHRHHRSKYGDDRDYHRGRSRGRSPSPVRSSRSTKSHHRHSRSEDKMAQAARAALAAGAIEAFRVRKDPGEWTGEKGKRILTAAVTGGGADALIDKDPHKHEKRHVVESTLAGLAANHAINGPRSRSRSHHGGGSHSRSKSHGGHGRELAAAGLLAAAGKKAYDRYRSRSRPRSTRSARPSSRSRGSPRTTSRDLSDDGDGYSDYSDDSRARSPSPRPVRGSHKRSKSVSDYINRGMASLGLNEKGSDDRRRSHSGGRGRSPEYSDEEGDGDYSSSPSRSGSEDDSRSRRRHRTPSKHSRR